MTRWRTTYASLLWLSVSLDHSPTIVRPFVVRALTVTVPGRCLLAWSLPLAQELRIEEYAEETLPTVLASWERTLGKKEYLLGSKLTFVDFVLYEFLDTLRAAVAKSVDSYPGLSGFCKRIEVRLRALLLLLRLRCVRRPRRGRT